MTNVVISRNDETSIHKRDDQMKIAARVLAETVHELHDTLWLASWDVDPTNYLVTLI